MAQRRSIWRVLLAVAALGPFLAWAGPARAAGFGVRSRAQLLPGVEVQGLSGPGLSLDVGRVARGAPVRVEVVASGEVAGGVETTSSVCRRVGGILCVNGDFAECRTCTAAFGGIIRGGTMQRSPVPNHPQLSLGPAGPGAGILGWSASLEASVTRLVPSPPVLLGLLPAPPPTEQVVKLSLALDAVNRSRGPDQVVLYTPAWAADTRAPAGGEEAVIGGGAPRVGADVPVGLGARKGSGGSSAIPGDGMILSAEGAGAARMRAFWASAVDPAVIRRTVTLRTTVSRPAQESVGGIPSILDNGRTVAPPTPDPFVAGRNPRTLVGWNSAGDLMLVTIDGRQPGHSDGVSLAEGADVLRQIGATSGFNLDGGGSSTFVSLPPGGRTPQVLNQPSDGTERRVTTILAVIPINPAAVRAAPPAAGPPRPPPPKPAPPGPPPVDPASTDGLPTRPAAPPAPTTTNPPVPATTVPPANLTLPPAVPETVPPEPADIEVAAPALAPTPARAKHPSIAIPAAFAALALAAAATGTVRRARRR